MVDPQPIAVIISAGAGDVADLHLVFAILRQRVFEPGIRVVEFRPDRDAGIVVVDRQRFAVDAEQPQMRIQRAAATAGKNLQHHVFSPGTGKTQFVTLSRNGDFPVNERRNGDHAGGIAPRQFQFRKRLLRTPPGAFAGMQPVDEILAAAIKRVANCHGVPAVGGNPEVQQRIRIKIEVVGKGGAPAVRAENFQHRLEMARYTIPDNRQQSPAVEIKTDRLPAFGGEDEAVAFAGKNLTVEGGSGGKFRWGFLLRSKVITRFILFSGLADLERHRIAQFPAVEEPQFPRAGFCIRRYSEPDDRPLRDRRTHLQPVFGPVEIAEHHLKLQRAELVKFFPVGMHPSPVGGVVRFRRQCFPGNDRLDAALQVVALARRRRSEPRNRFRGFQFNAATGDENRFDVAETTTSGGQLHGFPLFPARRIEIAEIHARERRHGDAHQKQKQNCDGRFIHCHDTTP